MARFSFSPKSKAFDGPRDQQKDEYDSFSESSSLEEPTEDESEDGDEDEEEEAHPLGFSGYGSNRIGLIRGSSFRGPKQVSSQIQHNYKSVHSTPAHSHVQATNNVSPRVIYSRHYIDTKTPVLLKHHQQLCLSNQSFSYDIHHLQDHMKSLGRIKTPSSDATSFQRHGTNQNNVKSPLQAVQDLMRNEQTIRKDVARKREQIEEKQRIAVQSFIQLLQQDERDAATILDREQKQQQEYDQQVAEEEKNMEHRRQLELSKEKEMQRIQDEKRQREDNQLRLKRQEEEREQLEFMKKREYITLAYNMVEQVKHKREQLEKFEKNPDKAISRRRLEMKKIARGKLNTVSHDKDKIISVAHDVVAAFHSVLQEDRSLGQQFSSMGGDQTPMLGASYFMDLIASNVIVRIQAEGFNGTRGDGFPLAVCLAMVSTELPEEFITLLQSHIYIVCPTAIPSLPKPLPESSEGDLMESLGMIKDKNGEYESFERFLGRTEGIISMVGAIMASMPNNHKLFGGKESALEWLERFIDLLSIDDNPLPLLTAPVLVAYLTATGHMLAHCFPEAFQKILAFLSSSILPRLDISTIGQPSATRLKKLLSGGMNGFISDLPSGALAELYNANVSLSNGTTSTINQRDSNQLHGQNQSPLPISTNVVYGQQEPVFNTMNADTMDSSIDAIHSMTPALPFGVSNLELSQDRFVHSSTISQASPFSTFGGGSIKTHQQSPAFGVGSAPISVGAAPFGSHPSTYMQGSQSNSFGTGFTNPSPFSTGSVRNEGQSLAPSNISPFGGASHIQPVTFGSSISSPMASNTKFGSGLSSFTSTVSSSQSPFGTSMNLLNTTPVGTNTGFSTFGNALNQPNNRTQQTPFGLGGGGMSKSTNAFSTNNRPPCKFFQQGKCRNGNYCNFSHSLSQDSSSSSWAGPGSNFSPFGAPRR